MPEVSYESWGSRLGKAVGGVIVGIILFLASFGLLFWNEGNYLHTAQALQAGQESCLSVSADKVDEANEGKLVCVSGKASTSETLKDPDLGVSLQALKLDCARSRSTSTCKRKRRRKPKK